jgi:hypothetical protein
MSSTRKQIDRLLSVVVLLLGLLCAWVGLGEPYLPRTGFVLPVTFLPEWAVQIWPVREGLLVALWHQAHPTKAPIRLAFFTLPSWPIAVITGSVILAQFGIDYWPKVRKER